MAALCVVLLAFAAIEQVTTAHAAELCRDAAICAPIASENSASDESVSQSGKEAPSDKSNFERHHCCGAHTSAVPAIDQVEADVQVVSIAPTPRDHAGPLSRAPNDLERPPRANAIV